MGIGHGDGVGIMCRNHRGFVEATLAAAKLGASALYLNTMFAGPQLVEVTLREGPKALVYDEEFAGLLEACRGLVAAHRRLGRRRGAGRADAGAADRRRRRVGSKPPPDKPRFVILTSGTTGTPKGAQRSSPDGLLAIAALIDRIPYRSRETMMIAAPLFHSWGFFHFVMSLPTASTMVLRRRFDPEGTLQAARDSRAEVLAVVPVMIQRILRLPEETLSSYDLPSLRITSLSGSALPGELATEWMDRFGDTVYNLYGSTEVAYATVATPADLRAAPGTAGRPPRGTTVRLFDEHGHDVPQGEVGRIFVGNDMSFEGYTGGGGKEAIDGLLCSGDVGHIDADGRLFIDGRDDEMIVSGGENVFPREVEDLLADHEAVVEVAVIGVEDAEFGQRLKAFVVTGHEAEVSAEELKAHVKANLASYKTPREVEFLDELPRNATGKILKRDLHARETQQSADDQLPQIAVIRRRSAGSPPAPVVVCGDERSGEAAASGRGGHRDDAGVAKQALEWVRVSEERVAAAEARADGVGAELKERAMGPCAARQPRRASGSPPSVRRARGRRGRVAGAEEARDRAEKAFEELQHRVAGRARSVRRATPRDAAGRGRASSIAEAARTVEAEVDRRLEEAREEIEAEADRRVAAAEQRAADAEAAAAESHETAVRLETEIERRVMDGTEEVRREAEESVRHWSRRSSARPRRPPAPAPRTSCGPSRTASGPRPSARRARPRGDRGRNQGQRQAGPARGPGGGRQDAPSWLRRRVDRLDGRLPHLLDLI